MLCCALIYMPWFAWLPISYTLIICLPIFMSFGSACLHALIYMLHLCFVWTLDAIFIFVAFACMNNMFNEYFYEISHDPYLYNSLFWLCVWNLWMSTRAMSSWSRLDVLVVVNSLLVFMWIKGYCIIILYRLEIVSYVASLIYFIRC